ncbi:MAG: prenyltransferase [Candidatus Lokiarchaeota archaeon]|nr:prenyltransferase [Candidatus Lokiarchaeota archaeon]
MNQPLIKILLLFRLARLHFLFPGFLLFLMGYLLAIFSGINSDLFKFLFGYLIFSLAHLSISFSNDYFDRISDINSEKTSFTGGSKVLVENPKLAGLAFKIAILLLVGSATGIVVFALFYGYSVWFVIYGIMGGLIGYFYTAPPLKFSYRGLGELVSIFSIGFVIPGMGSLVAYGSLIQSLTLFVFPLSCYGLFFILTVEMPDLESDKIAKKTNMIVKWGRKTGHILISISTALATLSILVLEISGLIEIYLPMGLFTIISLIPFFAALRGLIKNNDERKSLDQQVKLNMISIISFILVIDVIMASKILF